MRRTVSLLFFLFLLQSCAVDKVNLSPLTNSFSSFSTKTMVEKTSSSINTVGYASDLTNLMAQFPIFSNDRINQEIDNLKVHLSDYLYATKKNNAAEQDKAYKSFSNSYKNIQTLKAQLPTEERELLNNFLVKIKTNINLIDAININKVQ